MKRLMTAAWVGLMAAPMVASARPPRDPDAQQRRWDLEDDRVDRQDRRAERRERRQRARQEMRLRLTLRIADEVGLDEMQTLRVSEALKAGEAKRQELQEAMRNSVSELRQLANGAPSQRDVDARVKEIQDLRGKMLMLDVETLNNAAKGLAPHQKAKLALVLGMHERQMRKMMFNEMGGRGDGPPMPPAPRAPPQRK